MNGDYSQYINNIREDDIDILYKICQIFFGVGYNQKKYWQFIEKYAEVVRKDIDKLRTELFIKTVLINSTLDIGTVLTNCVLYGKIVLTNSQLLVKVQDIKTVLTNNELDVKTP